MLEGLAGFACIILLCFFGVRVGFASFLVGFVGFSLIRGFNAASVMSGQVILDTAMNYNLSVIPLFVLMGAFIYHSNVSSELYEAINGVMGAVRGALAQATILTCAGFAAVCGSSLATAAVMTRVSLPEMRRYNYKDSLGAGSIAAGGTLGILIPPSVPLIIYGIVAQQDIALLFFAGIIPGLLLIILFMAVVAIWLYFRRDDAPVGKRRPFKTYRRSLLAAIPITLLFIIVLGGLYVHAFTPTEAAGVGAVVGAVIALSRGYMRRIEEWRAVLTDATLTTCALFTVIIGALVFANFINLSGLAFSIVSGASNLNLSPTQLVVGIAIIAGLMGMIFESIGILLLLVPVFLPVLNALGVDLIWFGIIVVLVTELGLITPPIGMNVFVVKSMATDANLGSIFLGALPFAMAMIVALCIVILFPNVATFLPNLMG